MSTIEQLGVDIGDRVRYRTHEHLPFVIDTTSPRPEPALVENEAEIVDLDEGAVYLHPWTEDLPAFTRIQNTQTGEIYPVRAYPVGTVLIMAPLEEGERLVLAMGRHADIFSAVKPTELAP